MDALSAPLSHRFAGRLAAALRAARRGLAPPGGDSGPAPVGWLLDASLHLARATSEESLVADVARLAPRLLAAEGALVLLRDESRVVRPAGSHAWPAAIVDRALVPEEHPAIARALRESALLGPEDPDCRLLARQLGLPAVRIAALTGAGSVIGVVIARVPSGSRPIEDSQQAIARGFALQVGLAFERLRAMQALVDESLRDPLTGVGNRRSADLALASLCAGDALVMIDLDHFKRVNDSFGHAAGDRLLKNLASFLRTMLRDSDGVYRLGGEEFLLLLRGAGAHAHGVAERLLESWRRRRPAATVSAGLALHGAGSSAEETLALADHALYAAKGAGRDRLAASDAPPTQPGNASAA